MGTTTPVEEERAAQARAKRAEKARRGRAMQAEKERWQKFREHAKGKRCRCKIERGMTHDDLAKHNLRGPAEERLNCCEPYYICPTLLYALELTRNGKL